MAIFSVALNTIIPSSDKVNLTPEKKLTNYSLFAAWRLFPTLLPSADQPDAQYSLEVIPIFIAGLTN